MSYKIYDEDDYPHMEVTHNGWEVFGMSLSGVKPESRKWIANRISEGFTKQIEKARAEGYLQAQSDIRKALGIK